MAQEFLDCADVIAVLQHVRRKGMPKGVAAGVFVYSKMRYALGQDARRNCRTRAKSLLSSARSIPACADCSALLARWSLAFANRLLRAAQRGPPEVTFTITLINIEKKPLDGKFYLLYPFQDGGLFLRSVKADFWLKLF